MIFSVDSFNEFWTLFNDYIYICIRFIFYRERELLQAVSG